MVSTPLLNTASLVVVIIELLILQAEEAEQVRLAREYEEERRSRKAQYEATQKVQAITRGKQARAGADASHAAVAEEPRPATAP